MISNHSTPANICRVIADNNDEMITTAATCNNVRNTADFKANPKGNFSVDTTQMNQLNSFIDNFSSDEVEESFSDDEDKKP